MQYAPPQPVLAQQQPNGSYENLVPKKESRFKTGEYKDLWATILWVVTLIGFAVISYISLKNLNLSSSTPPSNSTSSSSSSSSRTSSSNSADVEFNIPGRDIGIVVGIAAVVGLVFTVLYFLLLQRFAGKMIKASLVLSIVFTLAVSALFFYLGQVAPGVIWLIFAAIYAWCFWSWRFRIPFAKVMLKTITSITKKYPAVFVVGVAGLIIQFLFAGWWIMTVIGLGSAASSHSISNGAAYGLGVYCIFAFYWTSQVIANTIHITVAGVFATYYFRGVAQPNGEVDVPVKHPTTAALKRALTTSLGPNCYGSLLIAIIQTIKALADNARAQNGDNIACTLILCCISCILGLIEDLLEYFNKYAFAQVAIYGKDYCSAAKDTWELTKARGIDAVINDSLIGSVLSMGGLFVALIVAGSAALFVRFSTDFSATVADYVIVAVSAFFVGIVEFSVMANIIDSGVVATFVCLAEDPLALAQTKPDLYQKIQQALLDVPKPLLKFGAASLLERFPSRYCLIACQEHYKDYEMHFLEHGQNLEDLLNVGTVFDETTDQPYWMQGVLQALRLLHSSGQVQCHAASSVKILQADFPPSSRLLESWLGQDSQAAYLAADSPILALELSLGLVEKLFGEIDQLIASCGSAGNQFEVLLRWLEQNTTVTRVPVQEPPLVLGWLSVHSGIDDYHGRFQELFGRAPSRSVQVAPIETRVNARIGLVGNPSDGFFGKCISCLIKNFYATCVLLPNQDEWDQAVEYIPNDTLDSTKLPSAAAALGWIGKNGYDGVLRLFLATLQVFLRHCRQERIPLHGRGFRIRCKTNIPRQVGLAGSSALVISILKSLLQHYNVGCDQISLPVQANLALSAEADELGIAAGHQDRVIQVYGGCMYMDFDRALMEARGYGEYTALDARLLPRVWIAYVKTPKDSGKVHSNVKSRFLDGDPVVLEGMREFARYASESRSALLQGDHGRMAELFSANFANRRRIYSDSVVGEVNIKIVEIAARHGYAAKLSGSGGCVIGMALQNRHDRATELQTALEREGYVFVWLRFAER
ncbi:hypothetical protein HDV03_001132 [Kappamyces sp. JEL0829]|nr:hypothetical protein HDV03_001132 [Kappamyces sp. JEL0829]